MEIKNHHLVKEVKVSDSCEPGQGLLMLLTGTLILNKADLRRMLDNCTLPVTVAESQQKRKNPIPFYARTLH